MAIKLKSQCGYLGNCWLKIFINNVNQDSIFSDYDGVKSINNRAKFARKIVSMEIAKLG